LVTILQEEVQPTNLVESPPVAETRVQPASLNREMETSLLAYRELLTELSDASFDLELVETGDADEPEKQRQRAAIKSRCDHLAGQASALRDRIIAFGKRASESTAPNRVPENQNPSTTLEK
jgi:hypothetical protein